MPRKEYVENLRVLCGMDRVEHLSCKERLRELFILETSPVVHKAPWPLVSLTEVDTATQSPGSQAA